MAVKTRTDRAIEYATLPDKERKRRVHMAAVHCVMWKEAKREAPKLKVYKGEASAW